MGPAEQPAVVLGRPAGDELRRGHVDPGTGIPQAGGGAGLGIQLGHAVVPVVGVADRLVAGRAGRRHPGVAGAPTGEILAHAGRLARGLPVHRDLVRAARQVEHMAAQPGPARVLRRAGHRAAAPQPRGVQRIEVELPLIDRGVGHQAAVLLPGVDEVEALESVGQRHLADRAVAATRHDEHARRARRQADRIEHHHAAGGRARHREQAELHHQIVVLGGHQVMQQRALDPERPVHAGALAPLVIELDEGDGIVAEHARLHHVGDQVAGVGVEARHRRELREAAAECVDGRRPDRLERAGIEQIVAVDIGGHHRTGPGVDLMGGAGRELHATEIGQAPAGAVGEGATPEQPPGGLFATGERQVDMAHVQRDAVIRESRRGHRGVAVEEVHRRAASMLHAGTVAQQGAAQPGGQRARDERQRDPAHFGWGSVQECVVGQRRCSSRGTRRSRIVTSRLAGAVGLLWHAQCRR